MRRQFLAILGSMLVLGSVTGCAAPRFETYPDALHSCRMMQPSRTLRKSSLSPTHPLVAACLERHGWTPEGGRR